MGTLARGPLLGIGKNIFPHLAKIPIFKIIWKCVISLEFIRFSLEQIRLTLVHLQSTKKKKVGWMKIKTFCIPECVLVLQCDSAGRCAEQ